MDRIAEFWDKKDAKTVQCHLCPHHCVIRDNQSGLCMIRTNRNGELIATGYGEVVSYAIDPIEKKPLYHFYPGTHILSVGVNGCNFRCEFCQNWQVSQKRQATRYISPEALVQLAVENGSIGIAFTYTEPLIWYEYIMDCAPRAHEAGLKIVLVSNGYIAKEAAQQLLSHIDAINIDLKSMDADFYKKFCGGTLEPVLQTIELAHQHTHVELTNLLITGCNDSYALIEKLIDFISKLDKNIPTHFSAYFPHYKMTAPPTGSEILENVYSMATERLGYVYLGNIITRDGRDTRCHNCGNLLIVRSGYSTQIVGLTQNLCSECTTEIPIII